jgi:predicted metal-dependent hydrolase
VNRWEARALKRIRALDGVDLRNRVGVTAATEHFTAIFAEHLLTREALLAGAEPRLATLWRWHSAEETEHRATAFDLYRALGGNEYWRLRIFRIVTMNFILDALRQTLLNLWRDGSWWRPSTWAGGARLLFGRDGLVRCLRGPWRRYLAPDFHPSQQDDGPARAWLVDNARQWRPV